MLFDKNTDIIIFLKKEEQNMHSKIIQIRKLNKGIVEVVPYFR